MRLFSRLCPSLRDPRPTPRLPPRHLQVRPAAAPTPTPAAPAGIDPHPGTSSSGTAAAPRPPPLRGAGRELEMPRDRDVPAAVRVYTVCDESRYLIVRNVPSLGCGDDLASLFGTYGPVEECTPMDAEDCEPYTDVFFVKFSQVNNARFAKRKLDESVFLGNRLQVTYAPQFESPLDTKEKLEVRRKEVLGRIKSSAGRPEGTSRYSPAQGSSSGNHLQMNSNKREYMKTIHASHIEDPRFSHVPSDKDYFPSESMNSTVKLVREKLDKIQSGGDNSSTSAASKKPRVDNRRRI